MIIGCEILNSEVKERIKKIESGVVPEGYKKTKLGIIPEEWEVRKIDEMLELKNGVNASKDDYGQGIKFINVLDILNNKHINYKNIIGKVDIDKEAIKNNEVNYGDVVFQRSSETIDEVGYANVYLDERTSTFGGFVIRGKKITNYQPMYLKELLNSDISRKQIESKAGGSTRFNIGQKDLYEVKLPIASLKEQEKISDILSTWDKSIENLEKLIDEKEQQKKGLMQILLTGEKRLEGFSGEWEEVKLGDIASITTGDKDNKDNIKGGKYPFYVRSENILSIGSYSYDGEAILIPGDGKIGEIYHYVNGKFDFHQRVYKISDFSENIMGKYIYFYFKQYFGKQAMKYTSKATVDSLRMEVFKGFKINLPPLLEQKAIAQILSTADKEIELLKELLENRKEQKKGLMQLLLTGIVRV